MGKAIIIRPNITEEERQLILSQKGLMLNGTLLKDESKIAIANAIQAGIALAEKKQKEK